MRIASREKAVFCLYQMDLLTKQTKELFVDEAEHTLTHLKEGVDGDFIEQIVLGTIHHIDEIDRIVEKNLSKKWTLKRLNYIDRAILRSGVYELLFMNNQEKPIVINAYIELAHKYSDDGQAKFVNAILDKVE